jgi:putative transposase
MLRRLSAANRTRKCYHKAMPIKHTQKQFIPDAYYHVYARGAGGASIFRDRADYDHFEWLLARSLMRQPVVQRNGRAYAWLRESVHLSAYCLWDDHFHLLLYQRDSDGMSRLMRSVLTAYTMYFNRQYGRRGPLLESTYRAVRMDDATRLHYAVRYMHLHQPDFAHWPHSSLQEYLHLQNREWLVPAPLVDLFDTSSDYADFMLDRQAALDDADDYGFALRSATRPA